MHGKSFEGRNQLSLTCHLSPPSAECSRVGGATAFDIQGIVGLDCASLMLWIRSIFISNSSPLGINRISFPFLTQVRRSFCAMTASGNLPGMLTSHPQSDYSISSLTALLKDQP